MITVEEKTTLDNICEGAAGELFDIAFQKVLQDLGDPNKKEDAVRQITLKFSFKNSDTPGVVAVGIECPDARLGPRKPVFTALIVGAEGGRMEARELVTHQQQELPINVTQIRKESTDV